MTCKLDIGRNFASICFQCTSGRPPCKSKSRENTLLLTRASEERAKTYKADFQLARVPRGVVPAFAEPDIHSLSRARRPSQMIECVFAASPETIRSEASGDPLSFAQSAIRRTWQPARCVIPFFSQWPAVYAAAVLWSSAGTNARCSRSTASKYVTIFRATASVARLECPFCFSFS